MSSGVERIKSLLSSKPYVIYMKGTPEFPMCGFSARTVEALYEAGVKREDLASFNVLEDRPHFEELKKYSNWPTSPQVYVRGKFVGGCDIVTELLERGELQKIVSGEMDPESPI